MPDRLEGPARTWPSAPAGAEMHQKGPQNVAVPGYLLYAGSPGGASADVAICVDRSELKFTEKKFADSIPELEP